MVFREDISKYIWDLKYRYRYQHTIKDKTIEATWLRVATSIASAEKTIERNHWQQKFYHMLENFAFLPGGRILAGAGTKHHVTLFNCFVMKLTEDSITGIFNALKEGALTLQQGGGIGYDFSMLRPKGLDAKHAGTVASGPISFMQIWDTMSETLLAAGARRGAMMGILRIDHPDIENFIAAKKDPSLLRHFNVSVLVSDEFMQAVKDNREWELVFPVELSDQDTKEIVYKRFSSREKIPCRIFKRVNARKLWQQVIRSAYDYAEPGVIFEDTINRYNNLSYCEYIHATNPCGEIPLPDYGACNLGAINLTQFIVAPFTDRAQIDFAKITHTTQIATRFLDNVIDVSRYPLKVQQLSATRTRRIGLGITGLADLLVMMNIPYNSNAARTLAKRIMQQVAEATWQTSIELAKEKGSFPYFDAAAYKTPAFAEQFKSEIIKYGMRNSHHNTIAPAGTISLLANNISSGIEPIFSEEYERRVRNAQSETETFKVVDYAVRSWHNEGNSLLPKAYVDSRALSIDDHLMMQATLQEWIDNAISKTINLPVDFPFEKLHAVYTKAHELRLKGCTVFRPNPITGSVLQQSGDDDVNRCIQC